MMETAQKFMIWAASLPLTAKILVSVTLVLILGVVLLAIWMPPQPRGTTATSWPTTKSLESLSRVLRDLSPADRQILREVAAAPRLEGTYLSNVADATRLSRYEAQHRLQDLTRAELVQMRDLTDKNYLIDDGVWKLLSTQPTLLSSMLQDTAAPATVGN